MKRKVPGSQNLWSGPLSQFLNLAPETRWIGAGLLLAVTLALGYWSLLTRQAGWVYLLGGQQFSQSQLQTYCQALEAEGLTGFELHENRLRVPRSQVAQYARALQTRGVLSDGFYTAFDKAVEQTSWWTSSVQQQRNWELAQQKSLAQMIEQMPEVEQASVLVDRSRPKGLYGVPEIRGTVTVQTHEEFELSAYRVAQIRSLIAGAVAALVPENVTVVDLTGKTFLPLGASGLVQDDLLDRIKAFESYYMQKIYHALSYIPEVLITVSVTLGDSSAGEFDESAEQARAGAELRRSRATGPAAASANTALSLEEASVQAVEPVPGTVSGDQPPQAQRMPKNVSVAIVLPDDVAEGLQSASDRRSGAADAWAQRIEEQVAHAIPGGIEAQISVQSYPRDPLPAGDAPALVRSWWHSAGWLPAAGLAAVSLLGLCFAIGNWRRSRRRVVSKADRRQAHRATPSPRRELVRFERAAPAPQTHLAQTDVTQFEDLRRLAHASLHAVVRSVESRLWATALRGASRGLADRILAHLPPRTASLLRDEIDYPGPVRLGDVEAAQQEVLEVVRRLDHNGDLVLEDREEVRSV